MQFFSWWNYGFEAMAINQWDNYGNISRLFIHSFIHPHLFIYLLFVSLFIDLFVYFKEHRDSLRVSIPFFCFATTRTPVEVFLLQNAVMSQLMFFDQGRTSFLRHILKLRLAIYTLIAILELV